MINLKVVCESHNMILFVLVQIHTFLSHTTPCHVIVASDLKVTDQRMKVTFPAGKTTVNASIGIIDDDIAESRETFHLVLEIPERATGNGVVAISPNTTEMEIIDNDGMK